MNARRAFPAPLSQQGCRHEAGTHAIEQRKCGENECVRVERINRLAELVPVGTRLQRRLDDGVQLDALMLVRFGLSAVLLTLMAAATGRFRGMPRPAVVTALLMGGVGYTAQSGFYLAALQHVDASLVTLVFSVYPLLVMVVAVLLGRERPSRRRGVALAIALGGLTLVLGRAAVDAYDWSVARNALANYASADPTQAVCLLMAEIEEGQNADQGKAREWLARAVRAPADPVWVADGITSDEWEPLSPVTGALDAFEWRVPLSTTNGGGKAEYLRGPAQKLPAPVPQSSETMITSCAASTSLRVR